MKYTKSLIKSILIVGWIGLLLGIVVKRQDILDWWKLRNYTAPASVATLARNTTMTDTAQHLFYVNDPQVEDKALFKTTLCAREDPSSLVLGCFVPNQGIFILNITDPRLAGEKEVTAAHEMLHAAYERMGRSEKSEINRLVEAQLPLIKDDRIIKLIESYKETEPESIDNEMHSIFGTVVQNLTPELEEHYKQYFSDRQKVVAYSQQYEQVFIDIKTQVAAYDSRLSLLKSQINSGQTQIKESQAELARSRAELDAKRSSGDVNGYNAGVAGYNNQVNQYNALLNNTTRLIDQYNKLVEERNKVALEQQELVQALDTNSLPTK